MTAGEDSRTCGAERGDFGWPVAEVLVVPDAENHLLIHVEDQAGNVLEETRTITLIEHLRPPEVFFARNESGRIGWLGAG